MTEDKNKQLFLSLIYSFQMQTMMQLGKLANPMSGTIEKDLDAAQMTIDMLDMLKIKSKGNTTDDESRFLDQAIADLKLNFVEEKNKDQKDQKELKPDDSKPAEPEIPATDAEELETPETKETPAPEETKAASDEVKNKDGAVKSKSKK